MQLKSVVKRGFCSSLLMLTACQTKPVNEAGQGVKNPLSSSENLFKTQAQSSTSCWWDNASAQAKFARLVPHYYEFNTTENPNKYWYCGHTSLKVVAQVVAGSTKKLEDIHNIFKANSPGNYGKTFSTTNRSSSLYDLYLAASSTVNNSYGRTESVLRSFDTKEDFYNKVMGGINATYPAIFASKVFNIENSTPGNTGHFYVITGYKTIKDCTSGAIDYSKSQLYLRDVYKPNAVYTSYDVAVSVDRLYSYKNGSKMLFMK